MRYSATVQILSSLGTLVCKIKEIKSFWPALAASCTSFARIATELDQTRLAFPIPSRFSPALLLPAIVPPQPPFFASTPISRLRSRPFRFASGTVYWCPRRFCRYRVPWSV